MNFSLNYLNKIEMISQSYLSQIAGLCEKFSASLATASDYLIMYAVLWLSRACLVASNLALDLSSALLAADALASSGSLRYSGSLYVLLTLSIVYAILSTAESNVGFITLAVATSLSKLYTSSISPWSTAIFFKSSGVYSLYSIFSIYISLRLLSVKVVASSSDPDSI